MKKTSIGKKPLEEGLRFECIRGCTDCCKIPGLVFVHEREIPAMSEFFKLTEEEFIKQHLLRHFGGVYQFNFPDSEPCPFLNEDGCDIYPVRPIQCRSFPFWPEIVSDPENWKRMKKMCRGIDCGRLHTIDEITDLMAEVSFGPFL